MPENLPIVVSYGAGVNSAGLLAGLWERRIRPDLIIYSNTGSDTPEAETNVAATSAWCVERGWPAVETVRWIRQDGTFQPLHEWCLAHRQLPSLAYGHAGCSVKWKRQPIDKRVDEWRVGQRVIRMIGIDAGEAHRVGGSGREDVFEWRRPLVEWGWDRDDCIEAAARVGLPPASKSSCWLCPAMRPREILALRDTHPDLLALALEVERNAETTTVRGLARHWSWASYLDSEDRQARLFSPVIPCACWEGSDDAK